MEKKFENVFELLAEAVKSGTVVEACVQAKTYPLGVWEPLKTSTTLSSLYGLFARNELRLKPKARCYWLRVGF